MEDVMEEEPSVLAGSYLWQVINYAGNFPLDVVRSLLGAYRTLHTKAHFRGLRRRMGNHILCPKCNTPWIAGNTVTRLMPQPRKHKSVKQLLRWQKKNPKGLTVKQRKLIEAYEFKKNTLVITCNTCKYKFTEVMGVPRKSAVKDKEEIVVKKKKKKRNKEINAGLCITEKQSVSINVRKKQSSGKPEKSNGIDKSDVARSYSTCTQEGGSSKGERTKGASLMKGADFVMSTPGSMRIPPVTEEQSERSEETDLSLAERLEESIHKQTDISVGQGSGLNSKSSSNPNSRFVSIHNSKPLSKPSLRPGSKSGSRPNSRPGSRPVSPKAKVKKEKALKIKGLQKALSQCTQKQEKDKSKSLHDFLSTLF